jgi:hypothetical protein
MSQLKDLACPSSPELSLLLITVETLDLLCRQSTSSMSMDQLSLPQHP